MVLGDRAGLGKRDCRRVVGKDLSLKKGGIGFREKGFWEESLRVLVGRKLVAAMIGVSPSSYQLLCLISG